MANLSLSWFGSGSVHVGDHPIQFRTRKAEALLIYLTTEAAKHGNHPARRDSLLGLLWPDYPEKSARQSLSTNLYYLRQALSELELQGSQNPFLFSDAQTVQVNLDAGVTFDVADFVRLLAQADRHSHQDIADCAECPERLESAAALYAGDFLEGFYLPDSSAFEAWAGARREQFRRQALSAMERLAAIGLTAGQYDSAEAYARRQLEIDNLRESAHRQLMEALARSGRRRAALSQSEMMRELLEEELGITPSADTEALVEAIQSDELSQPAPAAVRAPAARVTSTLPLPAFLEGAAEGPPPETTVFVGREQVLSRLDDHLESALSGRGRVVFVTGETGHGKTTLLNWFGRQAQANHPDLIVAKGNCNAYAGLGDPYLPFREMMGLLTGDVEAQWSAGTLSRDHALRLWRLLPDTAQAIVSDGPDLIDVFVSGTALVDRIVANMPAATDWQQPLQELIKRKQAQSTGQLEQAYLFDQYVAVLRSLAARQPLLLILDDLQWVDEGSVSLLFHLGRRLQGSRILVLGAYRPEEVALGRSGKRHPLEKVLGEFKRVFGDVWLDLAEAERDEGRAFVDDLLDAEPNRLDQPFRQTLFELTGGHPLFTVELLRTMQEREDLVQDAEGRWVEGAGLNWQTLPARVEGVIQERVGRLTPELRQLLSVASVEGEAFTAEVVAHVQEIDVRRLLRLLSLEMEKRHRLVRERGVISIGGRHLSRYGFGHILFQRYLYDDLSLGERRLLHLEVAGALAALYEAEPDEIAMQLAHHFLDAGEPERAVTHLRRAGDRARRLAALDEAAHFYSEALEYWPEADGSGRAELLRQLGECQSVIGDTDEALESFEASFSLFETLGDRQGAGAVQRLIGGVKWEKARWEEAHGHYLQSLAILERIPESVELAWTVSAISRMHMLGTEFDQAIAWGERALELAERFNAHDVTVNTLNSVGVSYFALGQSERGLSMLQDSLDRALALGLPYDISRARVNMFPLLLSSFRHGEARLLSDEGLAYTERHHMRLAVGFNRKISAELDWRTGQWARAASHIHALLAVTKDFRSSDIVSVFSSVVLGGMYIEFGQPYAAREVLEGLRPTARRAMQPQTSGLYFAALARAYAILGLDAETRQALEEFFDMFDQSANAELTSTNHLLFACQWLATRLDREALDQAQACLRRLERVDAQTRSPESAVCLSEARGSVALAMSDLHRAVEQLQEAAGRWDAAGRPYDHARALNHLGQALVQGGNVAAARATFEQALAIVDRLAAQLSEEELKASFLSSVLVQDIQAGVTAGD